MSPTPSEFHLDLPLYVGGEQRALKGGRLSKPTKRYWLSMNQYRNWDYRTSNDKKIKFKEKIAPQIDPLPDLSALWGTIRLDYVFYPPNKVQRDISNYVAVIDKFFCDALVESKKLIDDNMNHFKGSSWEMGTIDKNNPRLEVWIRPYKASKTETKLEPNQNARRQSIYTP